MNKDTDIVILCTLVVVLLIVLVVLSAIVTHDLNSLVGL